MIAERISQGYFVDAQLDLERMAAHGVTVDEAMPTVQFAIGGDNVVGIRQADKTVVPLAIQYSPEYIDTLAKVRNTPVVTADGRSVPLGDIADVAVREAPEMIRNDNGELAGYIYVYLRDIDRARSTSSARASTCARNLTMPPGYSLEWTGLYQYARGRAIHAAHRRADHAGHHVRPAADGVQVGRRQLAHHAVGAVRAGRRRPAAVAAGLLDDDGRDHRLRVAVRRRDPDRHHHDRVHSRGAGATGPPEQSYMDAVVEGSVARLRPKLMTVATTVLGLLPIMFVERLGHGHHEADRHADVRRHDQLDDLRAVPDPLPVRDRRGHPPALAGALRGPA